MMNPQPEKNCPCHSGQPYNSCCEPFHKGKSPENALQLMRSRYSAYALGLADYIIQTTHPSNPNYTHNFGEWTANILIFSKETDFKDLKILDFEDNPTISYVTFQAILTNKGLDSGFTEKSRFIKNKGQWLYVDGKFIK
ncbi:MAG: YchJ family metal-binding protein [Parachlamydiales bacterium]|jgi:SEC-C motif-containing protein